MNRFVILFFLLFISCHADNPLKTGRYKSAGFGKIEMFRLYYTRGITGAAVGTELILYPDSTYLQTTCGNISSGSWYTRSDSLFLMQKSNQWRNDSLRRHSDPPAVYEKPYGFKISKDALEALWIRDNGNKSVTKLEYDEH